jgi:hypothetical protein
MDDMIIDDRVRVRVGLSARGGRGVFACSRFEPGERVDACPVLVIPAAEAEAVCSTILGQYVFAWEDDGRVAVALGTVSLMNHDADPNASYVQGDDADTMVVYASRVIEAGDEILIDYTGGGALARWFTPRGA